MTIKISKFMVLAVLSLLVLILPGCSRDKQEPAAEKPKTTVARNIMAIVTGRPIEKLMSFTDYPFGSRRGFHRPGRNQLEAASSSVSPCLVSSSCMFGSRTLIFVPVRSPPTPTTTTLSPFSTPCKTSA